MNSNEFRQLRAQLGISQAELGRIMGLTAREISRIEISRNPTRIQAAFIRHIAGPAKKNTLNQSMPGSPGKEKNMTQTFTEIIESRGVEKGSVRWHNLRTEYEWHLDNPGRQWGVIWHAAFGCGDDPPNDLPLE